MVAGKLDPVMNQVMHCHEAIDRRSLEMDRIIARRLDEQPHLLEKARTTLNRWLDGADPSVMPTLQEWNLILCKPLHEIQETLRGEDERSCRLRQSSPFCGILTSAERTRILMAYDQRPT